MSGGGKAIAPARLGRFKPYPAYEDSRVKWLGDLPAHWAVRRLKRLVQFRGGGTPAKGNAEYWRGEIPWVSPKDMKVPVIMETEDKITSAAIRESATRLVPAGAVLIVVRSGILAHCIPVALAGRAVTLNQDMKAMISGPELVPEFLMYVIEGMQQELLVEWRREGATVESIELDLLACTPTPVPARVEQRAIATFLDRETARIDALVAKQERLIELHQEKRAALITRTITKGQNPTVRLAAGTLPSLPVPTGAWKVRKLRRLLAQVKRPVSVELESQYREIGIRSWGKGLFHKEPTRGALLEDKSIFHIRPGDLVLNIVFAWEGAVAVASEHEAGMVASHRFPTFRPSADVDLDYLLLFLQSEQGRALMAINSPGAAGRNRTIRLDQFLDEEVAIPALEQQLALVAGFRREEKQIEALVCRFGDAIDLLTEFRTALVSAAVTGKIDVRAEVA